MDAEFGALDRARLAAAVAGGGGGGGGEGAFACVAAAWRAHEAELRGYLRQRVGDEPAADDLLQDVFVKAMRQGRGFCTLDNPRAWLFQVARNALVDRLRTTHAHEPLTADVAEAAVQPMEAPAPIDALSGCVARTLAELAPEDAAIVRACDLEGLTQREFAERNGLSLSAAKSRLLRARQRLREQIRSAYQVRHDADGRVSGHVPRTDSRRGSAARPGLDPGSCLRVAPLHPFAGLFVFT